MSRSSKLPEKGTRIPDAREVQWEKIVPQYLKEVDALNTESARSHRFATFVHELIGIEQPDFIENYYAGIEKCVKVRQKDCILKGRADNLFGNVIIEFEANITKKRDEAEEQLRRYAAILWSNESPDSRTPFLCIATDGVRSLAYSPIAADTTKTELQAEDVRLELLEEADWGKLKHQEVYYWLDRYFLRKEDLRPTSETIVQDFGPKSHAFQTTTSALSRLWQQIKGQSTFAVIYDSWEKYLRIVYGSAIAGDELFIRHTYLATLAKLMSWMRITESKSLPDEEQILEILEGRFFKKQGIENFIEEDFFSWLARAGAAKTGVEAARWLFSLLQNYNLRELSEDVLKSLYQELVDPAMRHDLGEFYTPDWLAHRIVSKLLDENPRGMVLDPACGSGTFLYLAIREKRERLGSSVETLRHILEAVYSADVHPLAVIVAKTNYILALGDLLKKRKGGKIAIPIYLADTIKLPEQEQRLTLWKGYYRVELDGRKLHLPIKLFDDLEMYDNAVELAKEFARDNKGKEIEPEAFGNFLQAQNFPNANDKKLIEDLFSIAETLKYFIDLGRDTIWAFVLKNIYKPFFFKHKKFDFIVGNPPWIAFRYFEPVYQEFLKRQITQEYKLLAGRGHLITHIEIATLFFLRAADLYLKTEGTIAFVLPRSLFSADQHDGLRKRSFKLSEEPKKNLIFRGIWDCENVQPLFNVPTCVLMAEKGEAAPMAYPVCGQILSGTLLRKNASLHEAEKKLNVEDVMFSFNTRGKRSFWGTAQSTQTHKASFYKTGFYQGATIVPRSFWFVQVKPYTIGFDTNLPPLETDARAIKEAKPAYKDVCFKDTVERSFLYATLLSADLLPFAHLDYRLVVLPIEPEEDHYKLIDAKDARRRGFLHMARWLEKGEKEWTKRRGSKAKMMNIFERLDRVHGLTRQNPQAKYRVLYNTSGTFLTSAVVRNEPIRFACNCQEIKAGGFLADHKAYYLETSNLNEAYYLSAILNAPKIDALIKPMQSKGSWGPRDIHKKVLELPIPKFASTHQAHLRLAELGEECSAKVKAWLERGGTGKITSIGKLRSMVRAMLKAELGEIDKLVEKILE